MAKDPAFLFYYQDFLVGTTFMTDNEVGKYIKILCHLADKRKLSRSEILEICNTTSIPSRILRKLDKDENGYYYNKKLNEVLTNRKRYVDSRIENLKGKRNKIPHMGTHMENENENENENEITLNKVREFFKFEGSEEMAEDFYNHYEGQGWLTSGHNPVPIVNWRSKARQWMKRNLSSNEYRKVETPQIDLSEKLTEKGLTN